jgi:hypothetical protein
MYSIGAVLAAIAAVVATFGYILFGKPKVETTRTVAPTEKVQLEPSVSAPTGSAPKWVEPSIPLPVADTNVDPWDDETPKAALSLDALTLDTVEQPEESLEDQSSDDIPMELNLDNASQVNEAVQSLVEISTARYAVPSIQENPIRSQVFVAIRDPNCPPPEFQELSQQILGWGQSGTAENLKTVLSYAQHPDAVIRRYVAVAIGQVMTVGTIGAEIQLAVPVLETLTLDSDMKVQKIAAKSLKVIQG